MDLELLHFPYCTFNEKARWALDYKGVPHRRRALLATLHRRRLRRLTGQTETPVLRIGGRWVAGSTPILHALDELAPARPLFPAPPGERRAVDTIIDRFDTDWAPRARRAILAAALTAPGYLADLLSAGQPTATRIAYRLLLRRSTGTIRRIAGLTGPGSVENGHAACREALSFVAEMAGPEGYLVGGRFTAADLSAAALLAPLANPPDCEMTRPQPQPDALALMHGVYADHPGTAWVLEMYRRHRSPSP